MTILPDRPPSTTALAPAAQQPQRTHLGLLQCHCPLCSSHLLPCARHRCFTPLSHESYRSYSQSLDHNFLGPHQVTLAVADISRHMCQEGSLGNTSVPPLGAVGQGPTGCPPPPSALLASPLGFPASFHGTSQAALRSPSGTFSYFLFYPG